MEIFLFFLQILADPSLRGEHGHEAILLICILVSYRKNEVRYHFQYQLSISWHARWNTLFLSCCS